MNKFWETFGKLAMVLSVVFGALAAYDSMSKKKADVLVAVGYNSFTWPRIIDNKYDLLSDSELESLNNIKKHSKIQSSWSIGIHNNGDKEANRLKLKLPYTYSYQLSRDGHDLIEEQYKDIITIPDLQPTESIYIVGWSTKNLSDEDVDSIYLTHSEGLAEKVSYLKVKRAWKVISNNFDNAVIFICFLVILILGYQLYRDHKPKSHNKQSQADS
ncbi:hypothetical protein [Rheinheimera soli]|uniref:hypothetical protein n=1 Tax=Rheinheimera soli TaxID=443616 RepID=UPI001E4E2702|nr:hypothetical protein [Rheinheimera soli]